MKLDKRFWSLLYMGIALTSIIILSAGINNLDFSPGKPIKISFNTVGTVGEEDTKTGAYILTLFRMLLVAYLACIPIAIFLISPRKRKQVAFFLVLFFFLFAFFDRVYFIITSFMNVAPQSLNITLPSFQGQSSAYSTIDLLHSPPRWLTLTVSTGVAILIVAGAVVLIRHITNRSSSPSGLIRNTMQDALLKLHEGADLKHIIVRCYYEMGQVLMKERGITRNRDMTPREFESVLCNSGLPNEPLFQLTRLFEEIRYGNRASGELEKRDAIRCLTAIIKACETEP